MICETSAKYCKEWAADFRQMGEDEISGFWMAVSMAFKNGMQVYAAEHAIDHAVYELKTQIELHPKMLTMTDNPRIQEDLKKIHEERLFVLPKLEQLASETLHME